MRSSERSFQRRRWRQHNIKAEDLPTADDSGESSSSIWFPGGSSSAASPSSFPQYFPPDLSQTPWEHQRRWRAPGRAVIFQRDGGGRPALYITSLAEDSFPLPAFCLPAWKTAGRLKTKTNTAGTHFTRSSEGRRAPAVSDLEVLPVTFDPRSPEAAARCSL